MKSSKCMMNERADDDARNPTDRFLTHFHADHYKVGAVQVAFG